MPKHDPDIYNLPTPSREVAEDLQQNTYIPGPNFQYNHAQDHQEGSDFKKAFEEGFDDIYTDSTSKYSSKTSRPAPPKKNSSKLWASFLNWYYAKNKNKNSLDNLDPDLDEEDGAFSTQNHVREEVEEALSD
eukprot:Pgem_evm1s12380